MKFVTKHTIVVVTFLMFSFASLANSAQPDIGMITPPGVVRGKATEITISGARLGDAKQLLFYYPGIEVTNITAVDDNTIKATINVPADYPCDLQAVRVSTATGLSNLRLLGVGAMPIIDEVEPNSEFATPQPIAINSTIHGVVRTEDVDYFVCDLTKGQTLTVELEGLRLSSMYDFFDPFVAILDSNRFEMARSDDAPFVQQDCVCSMVAPADGKYIIEVRESSFGGSDRSQYRLHVGNFPRPLSMYPAGGIAGQPLEVTCIDALGQQWKQTFNLPAEPSPIHRVWSEKDGLIAPSPNYLRISKMPNVMESPDNDQPGAGPVQDVLPAAFNGILEKANDIDWFVFAGKKDQQLEFRAIARAGIRSPVDASLMINKVGGGQLAANDDNGGPDAFISFKIPEDGNYAIGIRDHLGKGGPYNVYRIEVAPPAPEVATSVNELERWVAQTVVIPQGARMAVQANLVRRNVGGDGKMSIPDLPPGVTFPETTVTGDLTMIPMMLHAAPDTAVGAKLVDLTATLPLTPEQVLTGHLEQRAMIVRGQNNVDVWGHNSNRLAISVADPAPFDIQVVQPQVPLVRDGSMTLTVKAIRKEGFDKEINLRLLYAPPGVAASGSIAIPAGQTEAAIPLTGNGGAAIRVWPITVLASAETGRGRVEIASEYIQLEVTDSIFQFQFNKAATEQGKPVDVLVGITAKREFEGTAEIELLGLPPGTTLVQPKVTFASGMERLAYSLTVPPETRQGNFKTLVCQAIIRSDKGIITQTNGTGEVQIDVPLPAPAAPVAAAPPPPMPTEAAAPVEKPLTRLEQLRKIREGNRGGK